MALELFFVSARTIKRHHHQSLYTGIIMITVPSPKMIDTLLPPRLLMGLRNPIEHE
jgi:hypothetical protein